MSAGASGRRLFGLLAEFRSPEELLQACRQIRDAGYRSWDAHTPFPVHGLEAAMGIRHTVLPWLVLCGGLAGALGGLLLQWWTNALDYPLIVSGKPLWSLPANIPVAFEMTILLSAVTAFFGMFALNRLPRFSHPAFRSARFRRATTDGFFVTIEADDPRFDVEGTEQLLRSLGASAVEWLEDEED